MHLSVFCVTCTLERPKLQQVMMTGQRSEQTGLRIRILVFVSVWTVCVRCRRNRFVFAPCRVDLMLWLVFKLQWLCVMFAFFKSLPSSSTCTFLWVKRVNKHGGVLMCLEEPEWRWLCSTSLVENGGVIEAFKIGLLLSRFRFDTGNSNKIFEHAGIRPFYFKFVIQYSMLVKLR